MMKKHTLIFILLFSFANLAWCSKIIYPWRAATAIVKSGESFDVWFNADAGQTVNSVTLQGLYNSVATTKKIESGSWIYDVTSQNRYNTRITVTVPATAPADRYDIILNTSTRQEISLAAVKVIKGYKSSYYILHFSDAHAFQHGSEVVLPRLSAIIDIANIINPELVFNTGDNLYRPTNDKMNQLFIGDNQLGTKGLNKLNAATFTVAGNHDYDFDKLKGQGSYKEKSDWWNNWWGLQAYNFKYDKARYLAINDGWDGFNPIKQMNEANTWLKKEGKGNLRVCAAHIKNQELTAFDSIVNLGFVMIGHNHNIANQNPALLNNKPIQYIVNSIRDHMEFNLYKVDGKTGKVTPVGSSTAEVEYIENPSEKDTPALYKPKLTLNYSNANDGSNATNTATIINKFDFPIKSAKVRFVLPFGTKYFISKGSIEQAFDGTSVHIVDVTIDLEADSTTEIKIGSLK